MAPPTADPTPGALLFMEKLRLLLPINSKARERKFALALDAFVALQSHCNPIVVGEPGLCMDQLRRCTELARAALIRDEHHLAWLYLGWIEREARERQYEAEWAAADVPGRD